MVSIRSIVASAVLLASPSMAALHDPAKVIQNYEMFALI